MPAMETVFTVLFWILFVFRYLRLVVGIFTFVLYAPKPTRSNPAHTAQDVTVVIPTTFKSEEEFAHCLKNVIAELPAAVIVVTSNANVPLISEMCAVMCYANVTVLGVDKLNKRVQMTKALKQVKTNIVVFADDDVFWPSGYLARLLAVFDDPETGAGGTRQRVRRNPGTFINLFNLLGISYLERRAWNNICTNAIDGSLSTLSGRTAAYRTEILQKPALYKWLEHQTDDDKCLTRYVYSHGWRITIQSDPRAVLETTLEDNHKFLSQCMRWARGHWRGNNTVMQKETYWRSTRYWWGLYVIYVSSVACISAILYDGMLFMLLRGAVHGSDYAHTAYLSLVAWILFSKVVKMIPHFLRHPQDMMYIPAMILFSYLHGFINIYACCTTSNTAWGGQSIASLEKPRAQNEEVVPLLRNATTGAEVCPEPRLGRMIFGGDYFSSSPAPAPRYIDLYA
ncbi:hypothetical protein LTR97_006947 [Elasticomyces elasticus]|uniref:Glycosyltransferase 2-like domain-containing protein n=1 Tax=Elasticomyces elasticus TaxID=574655 RepID=A0AAN7VQ51_9PEZI|nr:hypothetical protein LTR97_006947 [Elasticomyces elasticus]